MNNRTPGIFTVTKTPAGKPKIVDQNGFSIATGPDATKNSYDNLEFLSKAPEMYELLKQHHEHLLEYYKVAEHIKLPESVLQEIRSNMTAVLNVLESIGK